MENDSGLFPIEIFTVQQVNHSDGVLGHRETASISGVFPVDMRRCGLGRNEARVAESRVRWACGRPLTRSWGETVFRATPVRCQAWGLNLEESRSPPKKLPLERASRA